MKYLCISCNVKTLWLKIKDQIKSKQHKTLFRCKGSMISRRAIAFLILPRKVIDKLCFKCILVTRCEAKFSKVRLEIFKCTWIKCLLKTNLACSVKPTNFAARQVAKKCCPYYWPLMSKNNRSARAFLILVHFFTVLCKTTTWNDQIQGFVENVNTRRWMFHFLF